MKAQHRLQTLLALSVSTAALLAGPAKAGSAAADTSSSAAEVTELIVTAQKRAENVQDVPLAVTAVRGETLAALHVQSPRELVLIDPSVKFKASNSSGASAFLIRGVGTYSFSPGIEQSVSTVVDGVVLANPTSVSTLADIDHVEILRGPQGMLFGKNASAGVVSINTIRPRYGVLEGEAHLEAGEHGHRIGQLIGNLPVGEDLAIRAVATYNARDSLVENVNPAFESRLGGLENVGGMIKVGWRPTEDLTALLLINADRNGRYCCEQTFRKVTPGYAPAVVSSQFGVTPGPDNLQIATGTAPFGRNAAAGTSLELDYERGGYTLTSISAYRNTSNAAGYDGDLTTVDYIDQNEGRGSQHQVTQELRITSPRWRAGDYVAGLYYFDARTRGEILQSGQLQVIVPASKGKPIPLVPGVPPGTVFGTSTSNVVDSRSYAAFAQANIRPIEPLTLILGARVTRDELSLDYDRHAIPGDIIIPGQVSLRLSQDVSNTNFSWRVGAQYRFAPEVMGYVTVSRGYKGPGFSGLSANSPTQDQRVQPEIPTSYEAGLKSTFYDGRLLLDLALFKTDFKNFQAQVADLSSPTYSTRITNAGSLNTKGVEVTAIARPLDGLTLNAAASYIDARYGDFPGVQCYFGQPKVAQGGPCVAPPASPNSPDGVFNARGVRLAATPRFSYLLLGNYTREIGFGVDGFVQLSWNWQDDVNFQPNGDPGAIQPAYGILGVNLGVESPGGRWRLAVFANNLLDKRNVAQISPYPVTAISPGTYTQYFGPQGVRVAGVSLDARF